MRRMAVGMALGAIAGVSMAAFADPAPGLKPMTFLAGHCWKGEFPGGQQRTDTHCFTWLYEGKALRDTHTVRTPGQPDYVGETTYYWDPAAKRVEYLYIENQGGISHGTVTTEGGALVFPATQYVAEGQAMTYRVRWTPQGTGPGGQPDAYEAWSEVQTKDGWSTMFKLALKRQP
ncbi:hypothetical protein [Nitrospirillum sp. BR 11163]|uniref:hypothetical protein n=1 Tax=Nitrospirillum sp. BR 11163 TaxID=3104323 RepID=UPI002B000AFB|nr:hypothetical protein [Nitrospirillum sp. BR 11163]MEA1674242.1 hypothetical protein [Nitrospirillum sp. BR 11163]